MSHPNIQLAIGGLGTPELLVIFGIVVLLFGGPKLPVLGRSLGEGINNFKKAFKGQDEEDIPIAEVAPPASQELNQVSQDQQDKIEDQTKS